LALLTAREKSKTPDALLAEEVLEMGTLHGARATGLEDEIGSIEVGKRADLVIRRRGLPEAEPDLDPVRQMVLATRSTGVDTVTVEGEVIVENGRSTRVDEELVYAEAHQAARGLLERMGRPIGPRWPLRRAGA
jgi:cytosine/adenosine deaminase-related metal-dependent hydrolase